MSLFCLFCGPFPTGLLCPVFIEGFVSYFITPSKAVFGWYPCEICSFLKGNTGKSRSRQEGEGERCLSWGFYSFDKTS